MFVSVGQKISFAFFKETECMGKHESALTAFWADKKWMENMLYAAAGLPDSLQYIYLPKLEKYIK
jgi:hypothetical protein